MPHSPLQPTVTHGRSRRQMLAASLAALASGSLLNHGLRAAPVAAWTPWPFYVMDTGLVGPDVPTLADKVKLAKELGFTGYDYIVNYAQLPTLIDLLDKANLELTAIYLSPSIDNPPDAQLADAIKLLKGRPTRIELALQSKRHRPSDPAGDEAGLAMVRAVSDLCADSGPVVSIYPHAGAWTERVDDGVRLALALNRKNVGANFNLVHWSWVKQTRTLEETLRAALPHLFLVSVCGLAGRAIVPLDAGDYDVAGFVALLKKVGYTGRVGLQGYGIKGPSHEHLRHSVIKWHEMIGELQTRK